MIGESAQKQSRGNQKSYSAVIHLVQIQGNISHTRNSTIYIILLQRQFFTSETLQLNLIGILFKIVKVVLVCFVAIETFRVHVTTKVFELSSKSRELCHHKAKISGTVQK